MLAQELVAVPVGHRVVEHRHVELLSTAVRNAIANLVVDSVDQGSGAGTLVLTTSGDVEVATLTFSANANIRDTGGSYFYPVTGQAWSGGLDLTYDASRRFQLRGSASRSFLLRDVVFQRGDDHTESYRAGLRGPRFEVAVEYADTRSTAKGLLETAWLADANPDVLLATRPDLFGVLYASQQLRRALDARMTVLRGLDVFARGRLDRLELPNPQGTGYLNQNIGQVGATLGVRQLQLEIGWEYLEYWSHLVSTVDRRFLVRVRRDLVVR